MMNRSLRSLSGIFFICALLSVAYLLGSGFWLRFQPDFIHASSGALALIFVGASFICLQLSAETRGWDVLKGLFVGLAFVLWGGELYLPPGPVVTAVDTAVVAIFVIDLGLVIKPSLRRKESPRP